MMPAAGEIIRDFRPSPSWRGPLLERGMTMQLVRFLTCDDFGKPGPEIYINPERVRSVEAMAPYSDRPRARILFGGADNITVAEPATEVCTKLTKLTSAA